MTLCHVIDMWMHSISEGTPGELKRLHLPEEEKENSIPLVAASKTGRAQTNKLACWGCRTLYTELQRTTLDESSGKMNQRR